MSQFSAVNQSGFGDAVQQGLKRIPWYGSPYIDMASLKAATIGGQATLGDMWNDPQSGNSYQVVKAAAGLVEGQLVAWGTPTTGTVTAASSTVAYQNTNVTTTASEVGNYIYFVDPGVTFKIVGQSNATDVTPTGYTGANTKFFLALRDPSVPQSQNDPNVLASLPANGSALSIIRPWNVIVCTASLAPCGVAMGTVTSGNFTIVQKKGLAQILTVGSVTATVVNQPAVPGAAGVALGSAAAAASLYAGGGMLLPQVAYASTSLLTPYIIDLP